jgi:TRAP-type C4-dicarboxylate transport system permease small subunit
MSTKATNVKNMSSIFSQAKMKLTRLGLSLFYFYLIFAVFGVIGVFFGMITIIQKFFLIDSAGASWWDAMMLLLVSCLMVKIFIREAFNLLDIDSVKKLQKSEEVEEEKPIQSNVLPFDRTPRW